MESQLPFDLGECLAGAIEDFERCRQLPTVVVDMGEWIEALDLPGKTCSVCLAGSVIYRLCETTGTPKSWAEGTSPEEMYAAGLISFEDQVRLEALNYVRMGKLLHAAVLLIPNHRKWRDREQGNHPKERVLERAESSYSSMEGPDRDVVFDFVTAWRDTVTAVELAETDVEYPVTRGYGRFDLYNVPAYGDLPYRAKRFHQFLKNMVTSWAKIPKDVKDAYLELFKEPADGEVHTTVVGE